MLKTRELQYKVLDLYPMVPGHRFQRPGNCVQSPGPIPNCPWALQNWTWELCTESWTHTQLSLGLTKLDLGTVYRVLDPIQLSLSLAKQHLGRIFSHWLLKVKARELEYQVLDLYQLVPVFYQKI